MAVSSRLSVIGKAVFWMTVNLLLDSSVLENRKGIKSDSQFAISDSGGNV